MGSSTGHHPQKIHLSGPSCVKVAVLHFAIDERDQLMPGSVKSIYCARSLGAMTGGDMIYVDFARAWRKGKREVALIEENVPRIVPRGA